MSQEQRDDEGALIKVKSKKNMILTDRITLRRNLHVRNRAESEHGDDRPQRARGFVD